MMKIAFESTLDEAVDVQLRLLRRSKAARQWRQRWLAGGVLVLALFGFVLPNPPLMRGLFAFLSGGLFFILYRKTYDVTVKKRLKKILLEQRGGQPSVLVEYELTDDCLIYRSRRRELRLPWDEAQAVQEGPDDIEIVFDQLSMAVLPYRIFASGEQRADWLRFIKEKVGGGGRDKT